MHDLGCRRGRERVKSQFCRNSHPSINSVHPRGDGIAEGIRRSRFSGEDEHARNVARYRCGIRLPRFVVGDWQRFLRRDRQHAIGGEPPMGQPQHRVTEVAKTLSRYIKANLAEDLLLEIIGGDFPGVGSLRPRCLQRRRGSRI